jgi:hypothetical protein
MRGGRKITLGLVNTNEANSNRSSFKNPKVHEVVETSLIVAAEQDEQFIPEQRLPLAWKPLPQHPAGLSSGPAITIAGRLSSSIFLLVRPKSVSELDTVCADADMGFSAQACDRELLAAIRKTTANKKSAR